MKKFLLLSLNVLFVFSLQAQWSNTLTEDFNNGEIFSDMDFFGDKIGVVGGLVYDNPDSMTKMHSLMYKTTDKGKTWTNLNIPAFDSMEIYTVSVPTANIIYAASDEEKWMYKSIDGGSTWDTIHMKGSGLLYGWEDMIFHDENMGYAQNFYNVYYTRNGGRKWDSFSLGMTPIITGLKVIDTTNIVISATDSIYKTSDAGKTWKSIKHTKGFVKDVDFYDSLNGAFATDYDLYVTADGGESWKKAASTGTIADEFGGVTFFDDQYGIATVGSKFYFSTSDGGNIWKKFTTTDGFSGVLEKPSFIGRNHVATYAAGLETKVYVNDAIEYPTLISLPETMVEGDFYYSNGSLILSGIPANTGTKKMVLTEISGRTIQQVEFTNENRLKVNTNLTPGIYIVNIVGEQYVKSKKILITN